MNRFFVPAEWLSADPVVLRSPVAHQLAHVLRLRPGDEIALLGNDGWACRAELTLVARQRCEARVIDRWQPATEPRTRIVLHQALPKGRKLELILQKGTELGVSVFAPMVTTNCVSQPSERDGVKRERWESIVREAAEQSGRARMPAVEPPTDLATACQAVQFSGNTIGLMPSLLGEPQPLSVALSEACVADTATGGDQMRPVACVHLFIGPEGGFAPEEVALARSAGVMPVSLGHRVLRTETAAIVTVALVLHTLGDLA